ncbi:MAG: hypothetical protein HY735_33165 [Verrucomicrobia bacterium]|nr:hypothetical protein [Verrucomicrobiota bacterium]
MIETLEQLTEHVRKHLVPASAISGWKTFEKHGFVSFRWYERDFVVKRSLEVFEVKGQNLLATGASMLMQSALSSAEKDKRVVEAIVNSIVQAEDLISDTQQRDSGFKQLENVKAILRKLGNPRGQTLPAPPLRSAGSLVGDFGKNSLDHAVPVAAG